MDQNQPRPHRRQARRAAGPQTGANRRPDRQPERHRRRPPTLAQLNQELTAGIRSIRTAAQWQQWLRFAARFPGTSYGNLMLLYRQAPHATRVATYDTWHAHGIRIKAGETALRIVTETPRQRPGTPAQYRSTPVFDITQTTAAAPTAAAPPVTPPEQLWRSLVDEASARGYRVLRNDIPAIAKAKQAPDDTPDEKSSLSATDFRRREISIDANLPEEAACEALAHELAHVLLLHYTGRDHTAPPSTASPDDQQLAAEETCRGTARIAAESIAFMIMAAHGHMSTRNITSPDDWPTTPDNEAAADDPAQDDPAQDHRAQDAQAVALDVVTAGSQLLLATGTAAATETIDLIQERIEQAAVRTNALRAEAQAFSAAIGATSLEPVRATLHDAHVYYRAQLPGSWAERDIVDRNIEEPARATGAGLAPAGRTALLDHLRSRGHADKDIEAAGLATRRRDGQLQDRFRDRLMFPIRDHDNQIVGFTGRLNPDQPVDRYHPKWLNSPETVLYHKSEILDGLGEHHDQIRSGRPVVLVEGRADRLAVEAAGGIGLASGGTALTTQQADALRDILAPGQPVVLGYDDDTAGHQAAERAWPLIAPNGERPVTVLELGPGRDPGDANQSNQLAEAIAAARPAELVLAERQIDAAGRILTEHNLPRQYDFFEHLLDQHIDQVPVDQRGVYVAQLAGRLDVDQATAIDRAAERSITSQPADHPGQLTRLNAVVEHGRQAVTELAERHDEVTALVNEPSHRHDSLADGRSLT